MTASPWSQRTLARLRSARLRPAELFDAWMFAETEASLALAAWRSERGRLAPAGA
jgi:hypothetical protein